MTHETTDLTPTGRREDRDGAPHLVLTRTFHAAPQDVWDSVVERERLERWFGTWRGDPTTGRVEVAMTFDGMPFEPYVIEVCEPPHRLRLRSTNDDPTLNWTLDLRIGSDAGRTSLELAQVAEPHTDAADVGPGWEYQLDRLEAAVAGRDVTAVIFGDRYTALSQHYSRLFP